ncbi:hypothetical protein BKA65DRAFT_480577 [Rhexocercosporidium sp. MPI-PUGE-AT-0058]|nr:hypothetical protein BKA65DRAFT_480577 [Rhexocercosporidium sp. MPI-PUGE-AT-0058]
MGNFFSVLPQGQSNHSRVASLTRIENIPTLTSCESTGGSQSPMESTTILSFLESTRAYYSQEGNLPDPRSADATLNRDIENYKFYLASRGAYHNLSQFHGLTQRIRERLEYEFEPPPNQSPPDPTPSFAVWREHTCNLGPEYQSPLIFDTYAKCIAGVASVPTITAYHMSREAVAERDRRWLYGLSGSSLGINILSLQVSRLLLRWTFVRAELVPSSELARLIRNICRSRIIKLTIWIVTETEITREEQDDVISDIEGANQLLDSGLPPNAALTPLQVPIPYLSLSSPAVQMLGEAELLDIPAPHQDLRLSPQNLAEGGHVQNITTSELVEPDERPDPALLRHEWQQLAEQAEEVHIQNLTISEILDVLRDELARDDAEVSDDEDENLRFNRYLHPPRDDFYDGFSAYFDSTW